MNQYQVCIIGGGISGLHTAYRLARQGMRVKLLEARGRSGGRIFSPADSDTSSSRFDLGPSWFWPGQTHIESLVAELGLANSIFQQHAQGDSLYEPVGAPMQRGVAGISMAGSCRVDGGLQKVTDTLYKGITDMLGPNAIKCSAPVCKVSKSGNGIIVTYADDLILTCDQVVIALPPRVALKTIVFSPSMNTERAEELNAVATWMAGHAKVVVTYAEPFWRNAGLSGDVVSQRGPLSEIHDASSQQGVFALFGFFSTPPKYRKTNLSEISEVVATQLVRIFGEPAADYDEIIFQDWAQQTHTSTPLDQHIPKHHPSNYWPTIVEPNWRQSVIWSGSEAASGHYNGYIEGALIASEAALKQILH